MNLEFDLQEVYSRLKFRLVLTGIVVLVALASALVYSGRWTELITP